MHSAVNLLAILVLQAAPPKAAPSAAPSRSAPLLPSVARALTAERQFLDQWEIAWRNSEHARYKTYYDLDATTLARVQAPRRGCGSTLFRCDGTGPHFIKPLDKHEPRVADRTCYFGLDSLPPEVPDYAWGIPPSKRKIASAVNDRQWWCPNWLPPSDYYLSGPHLADERLGIDAALEPDFRSIIQKQRRVLIIALLLAVHEAPKDNMLVGQLVRMRVDAGDLNGALAAARICTADPWWCRALTGFVLNRRGEIKLADDAFAESMKLAQTADRCRLTNIGMILDEDAQRAYTRGSCNERDSLNAVTWWLADPLWSVPGNDRRTEQFARRVLIDLHAATGRDERYNWHPMGGGDALAEVIARYGWMSYASMGDTYRPVRFPPAKPPTWGTQLLYEDRPKGPPLPDPVNEARALRGVQTTFEYSIGRTHVIPAWSILSDPFSVKNSDWSLNAPSGETDATMGWWPTEHYAPPHPLIEIPDQQVAFLRRDSTTLIAYATTLAQTDLSRGFGDSVRAVLMASSGPPDAKLIGERRAEAHDRVTFLSPLPLGPSIVSAEIPWDDAGRRAARSRFGVRPPAPLSSMLAGTLAISDPVLLVVPPNTDELPLQADSAIALMRGSTTLSVGTNAIGVYWESYGFTPTDSVEVTLNIQRRSEGLLERVGAATGIGDPNARVSMSWREPERAHPTRVFPGAVPIQTRSVVLNINTLPAGTYVLEISMLKAGQPAAKSTREFIMR